MVRYDYATERPRRSGPAFVDAIETIRGPRQLRVTFSIVARDPATGDLGVAVASKFLAVGSVVPWALAGVGAIATQALANVTYGPTVSAALARGDDATTVAGGPDRRGRGASERQLGIVDARGGAATHTGTGCLIWAGGRDRDGVAVQGNILTGPDVVGGDARRVHGRRAARCPTGCSTALLAGDRAGGDARGRQSAALLVVRDAGGYGGR